MVKVQIRFHYEDHRVVECNIPFEHEEVLPGIPWGRANSPFTPAFWRLACLSSGSLVDTRRYKLGTSLKEEVVACLLGGHAVKGEIGLAAYNHLLKRGILDHLPSVEEIYALLDEKLAVGGRQVKYRFPRQKALYVHGAIVFLDQNSPPEGSSRSFRDWLIEVPGIGYKTASWITRNWLDAEDVAILDIHIHRAGVLAGVFGPNENPQRDYLAMERKFVRFAKGIRIPPNVLDNHMWNTLRTAPRIVRQMLQCKGVSSLDHCGLPSANDSGTGRNNGTLIASQ